MARKWNGFLAQNQEVLEQWGILEESRSQIEARLGALPADEADEYADSGEDQLPAELR